MGCYWIICWAQHWPLHRKEMKEINFFFFYEHCRQNHLLFHALEKGTDFSAASPLLAWSKLMGIGRKKELQPISLQWERGRALVFLCCSRLQEEQQHCLCPLGWATAHSLLHGDKNTFLPCQDVTRIKKYIKDSWMVSYYGNTATWQCRGALRPCLPCLRSALCIHAAETWMCLALLQGHSAMPLLPLCISLLVFTDLDGITLSLYSQQNCSRPLVALHWDLYLALQTQKWTQSSRCGLTRYE